MRSLKKNKQKMHYALYGNSIPVYDYYVDSEGNKIPLDTGEMINGYYPPVIFYGNISMSGGESESHEFGIDKSQYSAVLVVDKGLLPIDETSRIWYETQPQLSDDGNVDGDSADYTVVKIVPSLNGMKYLLKKVVK